MEQNLLFSEIISIIKNHRQNAYRKINEELVSMYYEISKYLSEKASAGECGDGVIIKVAEKIKNSIQHLKDSAKEVRI